MDEQDPVSVFLDAKPQGLSWSQDRRLKFVDFRLRWEGRINRTDLVEFFDISMPQATADLSRYGEAAPNNLEYDRSSKAYLRTAGFQPLYPRSSSKMYLAELLALSGGIVDGESTFLKWRPPVATLPTIGRQVDGEVLIHLLHAIREARMVRVDYQSVSRPHATQRVFSPHAFTHDGFRWHVRAYCHTRKRFWDFVVARIASVEVGAKSTVSSQDDEEWLTELTLKIGPHPGLSEASKRALAADYGMTDGVLEVKCRHAMLFYVLSKLSLLPELSAHESQRIVLINRVELQPYLEDLLDSSGGTEPQPLL
ncbi:WYL domain-containing protein [Hydrogenophaga sp.]|jgi:hypothetical protein|uniref:helix-turn-helix transcriptional regulator n=1 Tax=Hydrogenophaga sp. TaxID=1904254 RepID=UPI001AC65A5F|nr:WYL domain-containing protein [Hydrogenophaga sp.]MBN9373623.1 WYL domain-containing protein [Hydrogenophaga sp.]